MGLGCTHRAWIPIAEEIAKSGKYSFLIFDNRGIGHSSAPRGFYKTSRMALDVAELLDHLGPEWNRVHVVGISMGGMIAQELALILIQTKRLLSLALFVTHGGRPNAISPPRKGVFSLIRSFFSRHPEHKAEVINNCLYSQEFLNSRSENGRTMREISTELYLDRVKSEPHFRFTGFLGQIGAVMTHNMTEEKLTRLRDSGVPIVIGTGTKDNLVHYQNSEYLASVLNPVEFHIWEGAGHGLPLEKFQEFNEVIVRNFEKGSQSVVANLSTD
jgi:pimeloyl-ACP methyl ester carboxylesterase